MKRLLARAVVGFAALSLTGCTPVLLHHAMIPSFEPPPDQALCVVIRPVAVSGAVFIPVYLDRQYVGGTEGNTILSFTVPPGEHMIIADATNSSKVRFHFKPGKIYYVAHTVVTIDAPFVTINTSTFTPKTGADAAGIIANERGKSSWVQPNPAVRHDDLSAEKFAELLADYEGWARKPENAASARTERDYPGY